MWTFTLLLPLCRNRLEQHLAAGKKVCCLLLLPAQEKIVEKMESDDVRGTDVQERRIKDSRFADDMDLLTET